MISSRYFIVYFFGIGNLFGPVTSNEPNKITSYEFEVELLQTLGQLMNSQTLYRDPPVRKVGPEVPQDSKTRRELCTAAKNYVSFEFKEEITADSIWSSGWKIRDYFEMEKNAFGDTSYMNYLYCPTQPIQIYLRATDSPNKFVIALRGIMRMNGVYHGLPSIKEYSFKIEIVQADPVQNANAGELEKDKSLMENDDLGVAYKETKFIDWIHICLKAKDHVYQKLNSEILKPITRCSPVGLRPVKVYNYKTGTLEDHVAFRCPTVPLQYVYFVDSKTVAIILVLEM